MRSIELTTATKNGYYMTSLLTLEERVLAFSQRRMPGQPQFVHLGTSYLVNDLWHEVQKLRLDVIKHRSDKPIAEVLDEVDRAFSQMGLPGQSQVIPHRGSQSSD